MGIDCGCANNATFQVPAYAVNDYEINRRYGRIVRNAPLPLSARVDVVIPDTPARPSLRENLRSKDLIQRSGLLGIKDVDYSSNPNSETSNLPLVGRRNLENDCAASKWIHNFRFVMPQVINSCGRSFQFEAINGGITATFLGESTSLDNIKIAINEFAPTFNTENIVLDECAESTNCVDYTAFVLNTCPAQFANIYLALDYMRAVLVQGSCSFGFTRINACPPGSTDPMVFFSTEQLAAELINSNDNSRIRDINLKAGSFFADKKVEISFNVETGNWEIFLTFLLVIKKDRRIKMAENIACLEVVECDFCANKMFTPPTKFGVATTSSISPDVLGL